MTTLATFYDTFKDLKLQSVRNLEYAPTPLDLTNASLPCKWIDSLTIEEAQARAKAAGGERVLRCRMVVAVQAVTQETHDRRWSDTIAIVDRLNAGIKTVCDKTTSWTVEAMPNFWDGWGYAVVATIESSEWIV
jgi:hypothetical protein